LVLLSIHAQNIPHNQPERPDEMSNLNENINYKQQVMENKITCRSTYYKLNENWLNSISRIMRMDAMSIYK